MGGVTIFNILIISPVGIEIGGKMFKNDFLTSKNPRKFLLIYFCSWHLALRLVGKWKWEFHLIYFGSWQLTLRLVGKCLKWFFDFKKSQKISFIFFWDWNFTPFGCPQQPNLTFSVPHKLNFTPFRCPWQPNFINF